MEFHSCPTAALLPGGAVVLDFDRVAGVPTPAFAVWPTTAVLFQC